MLMVKGECEGGGWYGGGCVRLCKMDDGWCAMGGACWRMGWEEGG